MKRGVNKRAVTNVEMVVAIVIFIFTVFSMLVLFNVFHKAENKSNSLDEFEQSFLERAGNYTLVEVNVTNPGISCISIRLNENIGQENMGVFLDNKKQEFGISGDYLLIDSTDSGTYDIYAFSFDISPSSSPTGCTIVDDVYSIPTYGKIFSYEQLDEMSQRYYGIGYDDLKDEFGSDFILNITNEDGANLFSMVRSKPTGSEVYAKNFRIKIYNDKENPIQIVNAIVNVQTW